MTLYLLFLGGLTLYVLINICITRLLDFGPDEQPERAFSLAFGLPMVLVFLILDTIAALEYRLRRRARRRARGIGLR